MNTIVNATVGRYLFAIPFIVFGIFHFMNGSDMAGMVPGYFPAPVVMVYIAGLGMLLAGVSIIIQKYTQLACLLLAILLLIFVLTIHLPAGQDNITDLLKDLALAGGALAIGSMYDDSGSGSVEEA